MPRKIYHSDEERKAAQKAYQKKYKDKPESKAKVKTYREKPEVKARNRETALAEHRKASKQAYNAVHRRTPESRYNHNEYMKAYHRIPEQRELEHARGVKRRSSMQGHISNIFSTARGRAKSKGLPFTITEDFLHDCVTRLNGRCEITGETFDLTYRADIHQNPYAPSIDQKVPSQGYTMENVQIVASWYNRFKGDLTDTEALAILDRVALFRRS